MARNDPYLPDFATVASGNSVTFDGSASATGEAIVNEITGTFDCKIFIEESNNGGTSFTTVAQLSQQDGDLLFSADFHSQFNRIYVSQGERRIRFDNADSVSGEISITGDER
jgi:hypothetical protein